MNKLSKNKISDFQVSVILPIYNEAAGITETIKTINQKVSKLTSTYEIIAVNDGSSDNSLKILIDLQKKLPLKIIVHQTNRGYGAAFKSGIKHAKYPWVFFTDADLQFNIDELENFIPYTVDKDLIIGYRKDRADVFRRKLVSHIYNQIIQVLFGLKIKDVDCAFKLIRKSALSNIKLRSNSFFVSAELMIKVHQQKLLIKEIGVNHYPRTKGNSTVTPKRMLFSIIDLISLYLSIL